ncbi:MAG: site-specific DNA-methyltransferase [Acetobacterium sp.]|nr:site-specific DNA-methyltransferase [Acetobacterium sp.]
MTETINDFANDNLSKLAQLFPAAVKDGEVDFEALKQELGAFKEVGSEKYELTWAGKQNAKKVALEDVSGKTLNYVPEDSKNPETTENLYIEGDNLEVLKLLRQNYYGAIKMIYIDPPYNTGNDFVYNDNFSMSVEESELAEGNRDELGERYQVNSKSQNRYHANWLNMMYPRLKVAKDLLTEDGIIFISIDDNEVDNLKKVCDDVLGSSNFIANIIRNTNSSKNQSLFISVSHEYCLIFGKNMDVLREKHQENKWAVPKNNIDEYLKKVKQLQKEGLRNTQITEELKILTKYPRFIDFTNYWYFDERGLYRKDNIGGVKNGNNMPLFNPLTQKDDPVPPGGYRYSCEKLSKLANENRIHFHTDGSIPTIKRYLNENINQRPKSIMSDDQRPDYSMLQKFNTPFDNPKQLSFMKRILSIGDKDSLILDFFSGSCTTAHATMDLNAVDNGSRKFIMVQIPEKTDENSEAYHSSYKTICEIGKERIRRAGDKIIEEKPELKGKLDIGFKVFKVTDTNIKWNHQTEIDEQFTVDTAVYTPDLMDFMPGAKDEDIVYEVMLRQNDVPLSSTLETLTDIGKRTYLYASSYLVCLETEITVALVDKLAALNPLPFKFIFRDSAFQDDIALKDETFRRLKALIEKNAGTSKKTYTVEFI